MESSPGNQQSRRRMLKHALVTLGVFGVLGGALFAADKPSEDYQKAMKDLRTVAAEMGKPNASEDMVLATKHAATAAAAFTIAEAYWKGKADDALKAAQTGQKAATDMSVAAGQNSAEGVEFAFKEMTTTCPVCHAAH